ncbi:MAG: hypothetical protein NVSMB2_06070 [Chloroflexota bacterium]
MVAAAVSRVRTPLGSAGATPRRGPTAATLVIIGVPVLLALTFVWQIGSGLLRTDTSVHDAVAVSSLTLKADPLGSRIDFVLADRGGQDATTSGDITIRLREPDGTVWQTTRHVATSEFAALSSDAQGATRTGYSVIVPATDWLRAPRRGGQASVTVTVQPTSGEPFSGTAEQRFP